MTSNIMLTFCVASGTFVGISVFTALFMLSEHFYNKRKGNK